MNVGSRKTENLKLGPLESAVLSVLWSSKNPEKKMKVREVHASLKGRKVALTSIAVMLDRLYKKGLVSRTVETGKGGIHYIYSPSVSKEDYEKRIVNSTVERLIASFGPVAVSYFNERFSKKKG